MEIAYQGRQQSRVHHPTNLQVFQPQGPRSRKARPRPSLRAVDAYAITSNTFFTSTLTYLGGLRISDSLLVDPCRGLFIVRIVDLLLRVDGRLEVFEKVTSVDALAVEPNVIGVVRAKLAKSAMREAQI